jgi:hypothetical protein
VKAYFNTTGVFVKGHLKNRSKVYGVARFNSAGRFQPDRLDAVLNRVFECEPMSEWNGERRVLFRRLLARGERPDVYLVTVTANETGGIDTGVAWHHGEVSVLSFSECRGQQEAMLVMPPFTWIQGAVGTLFLEPEGARPWRGHLVLSP